MSKLIIQISKIEKIELLENADRLVLAHIKGWQCLIGKGQHTVGELVVFVPPDAVIPYNLIEELKLNYLKGHGRVKTVKLRGYISSGLVLPLSILSKKTLIGPFRLGDDVAKELGITKYEVIVKQPTPKKDTFFNLWEKFVNREVTLRRFIFKTFGLVKNYFKPRKKVNPNFDVYTDIDNIKHYPTVFEEGEEVVISEKIHGCGIYSSRVWLSNGKIKKLGNIVNQKLKLEVLGMDKNNNIIPVKITNWYKNDYTENWIQIQYINNRGEKSSLTYTPDHLFYDLNIKNYKHLKDFKIGDEISYVTKAIKPTFLQEQIMIGKVLGDGCIRRNSIEFTHKIDHKEYTDYTMKFLSNFKTKCNINRISGYGTKMYGFKLKNSAYINDLFSNWFKNGKKQVPKNIKLTPISLAFWYMDDGSLIHTEKQQDRISIATNGFNEKSINNLLKALLNLDIKGTKFISNGWRIRLNKDEAEKFFNLIVSYIPKCMQYKLPKNYRGYKPILHTIIDNKKHIIKNKIRKIKIIKKKQMKYDIETETNNYIVGGVVVHNSNFRGGVLSLNETVLGRIRQFFTRQTHSFCYGSHRVQKTSFTGKGFYGEDVYGQIAERYNLKDIIPKDYIIYGEIYGPKIQELTYGATKLEVVFFDVKYKGKYLDWEDFVQFCALRNLPMVPVLFKGGYNKEILYTSTNGKSVLSTIDQIREGCVMKPAQEKYDNRCGRKILKSISAEYLLTKKKENPEEVVDDSVEFPH